MNHQLALAIQLQDEATLDDFCWGDNRLLQQEIQRTIVGQGERLMYIWGAPGSGKTHLLQACCHAQQGSTIYLPLQILKEWGPDVLEGVEEQAFIGIDDIDAIAADRAWEEALFHVYNRIRDGAHSTLIIMGQYSPLQLPLCLPDLTSRLSWGFVSQLKELSDQDKITMLQCHAQRRGFQLSHSVSQFLLSRCARNMHDLQAILNRLDEASLMAKRKITIPFIKHILDV